MMNLRESEVLMDEKAGCPPVGGGRGTLVSFLPAHGSSRAGAVAEQLSRTLTEGFGMAVLLADFENRGQSVWNLARPRRLDGHTWGAFVYDSRDLKILDGSEVHPREIQNLMDYARENYATICANLTGARESHVIELLEASDAIFIVTGSDPASLEAVREKAERLRSIGYGDSVALLVENRTAEAGPAEIEEFTGLPVCAMVENQEQIQQFARWVAANANPVQQEHYLTYALAG